MTSLKFRVFDCLTCSHRFAVLHSDQDRHQPERCARCSGPCVFAPWSLVRPRPPLLVEPNLRPRRLPRRMLEPRISGIGVSANTSMHLTDVTVINCPGPGLSIDRGGEVHSQNLKLHNNRAGIDNSGRFIGPDVEIT
jgi:DNA-directed RNA polymerase subunit RPC12/RpoP